MLCIQPLSLKKNMYCQVENMKQQPNDKVYNIEITFGHVYETSSKRQSSILLFKKLH